MSFISKMKMGNDYFGCWINPLILFDVFLLQFFFFKKKKQTIALLWYNWCKITRASFHVPFGYLYLFFREHFSRSSTHFFDWIVCFFFFLILSCMSCLCILNIKSLSVALFADIFLPVCRLSFYFVSFAFIVVVQSASHVRLFAIPWTTACQASLSSLSSGVCPLLYKSF